MKITHVVENLNRGGLERMVVDLASLQQAQGHHCQVVCLYEAGTLAAELNEQGIGVLACHKRRGPDPRAMLRLRRAVRSQAPDVLHTHNVMAHYLTVLATRAMGVPHVINTLHGMGWDKPPGRRELLYRGALAATDAVVTVSRASGENALRVGMAPRHLLKVVPNGIRLDNARHQDDGSPGPLRGALGLSAQIRLIGTVGRLNRVKNQDGLIRAFGIVHRQCPDTALVLIGGGALRASLEQRARDEGLSDAVHFLGDRKDVRRLLPDLDMFVLSSLTEGYSMALLEACAASLPVIATRVGGNAEIIQDGVTGMLVEPSDQEALEQAMLSLLAEKAMAASLARAARDWVQREGSLEAMAARYHALYRGQDIQA